MKYAYRMLVLALLPLAACGRSEDGDRIALRDADASAVEMADARAASGAAVVQDTLVVYKTPTCGCCTKWVDHVKENGFAVVVHDLNDLTPIKQQYGVPVGRTSCHTATVNGYTIEGHVPADLIRRMLDEKAAFRGLAVPGMPMGSPGMEGLMKQDYEVLSFDDEGRTQVYAKR